MVWIGHTVGTWLPRHCLSCLYLPPALLRTDLLVFLYPFTPVNTVAGIVLLPLPWEEHNPGMPGLLWVAGHRWDGQGGWGTLISLCLPVTAQRCTRLGGELWGMPPAAYLLLLVACLQLRLPRLPNLLLVGVPFLAMRHWATTLAL